MGVCAQDPWHRAAPAALPGEQGGPPHCTHPGVLQAQPSRGPSWHGAVTPLRAQPLAFATPPILLGCRCRRCPSRQQRPGAVRSPEEVPVPFKCKSRPRGWGGGRAPPRDGPGRSWGGLTQVGVPVPVPLLGGGAAGACHNARGSRSPIPPPPGAQEELGGGSKYSGEGSGGVGSLRCSQLRLSLRASGVSPCPAGAEILFSFLLGLWEMTLGSNPRLGAPWLLFRSQPLPCALMLRHSPR